MLTSHFSKDKDLIFNLQKTADGNLKNMAHQKMKGFVILLKYFSASFVIEFVGFKAPIYKKNQIIFFY